MDSLTALIMFSSRGDAVVLARLAEGVLGVTAAADVVLGSVVTVVVVAAVTGDVVVAVVVDSVAVGVAVREANASVNPAQVGLLSGLVEH